jgi:glycosyltransferase involved in cell wall biosynthesis
MPVFNCARYLQEAIESILNQTFQDFEFVIVNDGSIDASPEILNEYARNDSRIRVINQPNSGIIVALNRGLLEAKGEWIFRMDGDDVALPHRFAAQLQTIRRKSHLVLLGGWCQQINSQGVPLRINKYPDQHAALVRNLETLKPFFPHPTACFRRDKVLELGGYRERFRHAEDADLWLRLAAVGEFACCQAIVLRLRKHENNISTLQCHLQQLRSVAARVCYFRRKIDHPDPSQMKDEDWGTFLLWIKERMEEEGFFQRAIGGLALRNTWHAKPGANKLEKIKSLLKELIQNPLARKAFGGKFRKDNLVLRLSLESDKMLKGEIDH